MVDDTVILDDNMFDDDNVDDTMILDDDKVLVVILLVKLKVQIIMSQLKHYYHGYPIRSFSETDTLDTRIGPSPISIRCRYVA